MKNKKGSQKMQKQIVKIGPNGTIQIPKAVMESNHLKENDTIEFDLIKHKMGVKKVIDKKKEEALIKEYFQKYGKLDKEIAEEWKYVSIEADRELDD